MAQSQQQAVAVQPSDADVLAVIREKDWQGKVALEKIKRQGGAETEAQDIGSHRHPEHSTQSEYTRPKYRPRAGSE